MKTLAEYGRLIVSREPVIIERTWELEDKLDRIAYTMYQCPARNRSGRTLEEVRRCTNYMVNDMALAKKVGFVLNPFTGEDDIDPLDYRTYAWDVQDGDVRFECKGWCDTWFAFKRDSVKTFIKNSHRIDFLACAKLEILENVYKTTFKMVADAKSFPRYICKSNYAGPRDSYYNHHAARRDGNAWVDIGPRP